MEKKRDNQIKNNYYAIYTIRKKTAGKRNLKNTYTTKLAKATSKCAAKVQRGGERVSSFSSEGIKFVIAIAIIANDVVAALLLLGR